MAQETTDHHVEHLTKLLAAEGVDLDIAELERMVQRTYDDLRQRARFDTYVTVLAERAVREQLARRHHS